MDPAALNDHLSRLGTCWNVLKQANGASSQKREVARAWFVERYEAVVKRYLAKAVGNEAAEDLTQEFAARFLQGRYANADAGRGRFRDYLKTCLFALVADFRKQQARRKTQQPAEGWDPVDPHAADDDHASWNQTWRGSLIERALDHLEREEQRDQKQLYTVFKFRLDHPELRSVQAAEKLSVRLGRTVSDVWFRKRLMASRTRFAALLLETVAESLDNPTLDQVKEELADLELLSYCGPILDRLKG
jgi:DNA-directed RNA polymerase specialized sigma24 family protein